MTVHHHRLTPIYAKNGNNPPTIVGYRCETCQEPFTRRGNYVGFGRWFGRPRAMRSQR